MSKSTFLDTSTMQAAIVPRIQRLLDAQSVYPKLYWHDPERNFALAAWGIKEVSAVYPHNKKGWWITARDFFPRRDNSLWKNLPSTIWFSPEEVVIDNSLITTNIQTLPSPLTQTHSPTFTEWSSTVKRALQEIDLGTLEKVVTARCTTLTHSEYLDWKTILYRLAPDLLVPGIRFAFLWDKQTTFLGNTPETLFRREREMLYTEAVAGTKKQGQPSLLSSKKDLEEFFIVRNNILDVLDPYTASIEYDDAPKIKKTRLLQHLWTPITCTLNNTYSDEQFIKVLHPTPSVGGFPKRESESFLRYYESWDRGWYAAPLGICNEEFSHFIVGIRSALLREKKMHLFAGTGIVRGSDPYLEWGELEAKLLHYGKTTRERGMVSCDN